MRAPLTLSVLVLSQACTCGDDQAALRFTPSGALDHPAAVGARIDLLFEDACKAGPVSGCTTEEITEIVEVVVDEGVFSVEPTGGTDPGAFVATAVGAGSTTLSITGEFTGDGQTGRRSASLDLSALEVDRYAMGPICTSTAAAPPWLIPQYADVPFAFAAMGEDQQLFHHDVDWSAELDFELTEPAGFDAVPGASPTESALGFSLVGPQTVFDGVTGDVVQELFVYDDVLIEDVVVESSAPLVVAEGAPVELTVEAYVQDLAVCVGDDTDPYLTAQLGVVDSLVCDFGNGAVSASLPLGSSVTLYGRLTGVCEVEATFAGVTGTLLLDVYPAE